MKSITWIIILIYCKAAILPGAYANCTHKDFEDDWKLKYGIVIWANDDDDSVPGVLRCQEDYVFEGKTDLVYCKEEEFVALDGNAKCIEDPFVKTKVVQFQGQTYNYTKIDVGHKTYQFPMKNPNITYVITTNYTASKVTPTIRVKVHLTGKAHHPILVNIQQSTESVGFELPLKVVGKESEDLALINEKTVELCPVKLDVDEKGKKIPLPENVNVVLKGGGVTGPSGNYPTIQVHASSVQHLDLEPGKLIGPTVLDNREDQVYRYIWPQDGSVDEVDILVSYFTGDEGHVAGEGPDVCSKISIRSGKCPLEEMGVNDMTFTRQAFLTVNRHDKRMKDIKDGFLFIISVFSDDYRCRSDPDATEAPSRFKTIQVLLTTRNEGPSHVYLAIPLLTCSILFLLSVLILGLFIRPLRYEELDEEIVDIDSTGALVINQGSVDPPFESKIAEISPKMVDMDDGEDIDFGSGNSRDIPEIDASDETFPDLMKQSFSLSGILNKVKKNEMVVNLTQTIGHCSIPLLVFLNSFDSAYVDIQGNLKEMTLDGNLDACYVNSRCAFPTNISDYRIPDISRVTSNLPYLVSGICFYYLVVQKKKIMAPINALGKGVKHDFALFSAIAFITVLIGIASAIYHVCPNQTTSRIDMYFIEILLGYYSLKLYQSRVPDIREVYYLPVITICVLSAIERVLGGSDLAWDLIGSVHLMTTVWVSVQLFFMGKVSMNPWTMIKERKAIWNNIMEKRSNPEFKYQGGFFLLALAATIGIAVTAWMGKWHEQAMYNVFALSLDICIYLVYYIINKNVLRREKMKTRVVVMIAASFFTWVISFIFFFAYKSIDTSASPAESRCLNKACIAGFLDGHDLWHCLSATAIFLTNTMILMFDDDLIDTNTEDTYF